MATAGGSGTTTSSAAAGTTGLSADQLRGYLVAWGVKADRVERRAERLAAVGVTLKGLAAVALQPPDVLLSFLIDQGEEATEGDRFDAYVISAGATAAAAAAGVVLHRCGVHSCFATACDIPVQLHGLPGSTSA